MKIAKAFLLCTLLSLLTVAQASAQSIVGAWSFDDIDSTKEGAAVFVFHANGSFYYIENVAKSEAPGGFPGYERGTYTWNSATSAITLNVLQDLNGNTGVGNGAGNGPSGLTFRVSGNTAVLTVPDGSPTLTRVTGASPIVGGWSFGNAALANDSGVLVFLPNGVYFMAEDGDSSPVTGDPSGHDGIEIGTYAWNPTTGLLTSSQTPAPYVDTNGQWGLSHSSGPRTMNVSADGLTLVAHVGTDSFSLARVGAASSPTVSNYQGLWYNAPAESEAGWGINFAHQGDVIFATWFTYDAAGKAWWLTMTATKTSNGVYSGQLIRTNGAPFSAYVPPATATIVGNGTLTFTSATTGSFSYTVNDGANVATQTKAIVLQTFAAVPVCVWGAQPDLTQATNYQDLWWATGGSESGWGVNLTHQGTTIFVTWFTYDANRNPLWLSATLPQTAPKTYSGTLLRTGGQAFNAVPFDPTKITRTPAGTATFTFTNGNAGTFTYNVDLGDGVNKATQSKPITRQVFRTPGTVCQ